ncbi:tyrosine-type recombinase/integrase [Sphingobium sp. TomMM35A]
MAHPPAKMKGRAEHQVPLSRQAMAILTEIKNLAGRGMFLFPSIRSAANPMSENTVNAGPRRLGHSGDEMTAHGFCSMTSTLLKECEKWHPDAIERALAHKDRDSVRAAYARRAFWNERVEMAQSGSDYLDRLKDERNILRAALVRAGHGNMCRLAKWEDGSLEARNRPFFALQ